MSEVLRREMVHDTMWRKLLNALPRGYNLTEEDWLRRHRINLWVLGLHVPALAVFGLVLGYAPSTMALVLVTPVAAATLGYRLRRYRRTSSMAVTGGLAFCSAVLVGLTHGAIEAHFHFFIMIGFIGLYQDWAPFLFNIVFTVLSHGIGSAWQQSLIFDTAAGQANPWLWSLIHGIAVLFACAGMMLFWRVTEDSQHERDVLTRRLADNEINRRQFTSDLLSNLARRNQSLLHRELDIINQLEESEQNPDVLAELFALDHIATRVRRNAENLLVLSGQQPPRTWSEPVPLRDVLRAAIAETENLERVVFAVDEQSAVVGQTVTDLTHLLAELTENAVRFSAPNTTVTIRAHHDHARQGGHLITIEDWGLGMLAEQIEEANALLAAPLDVDLSISKRLGFHVVARLAARHGIKVSLAVKPESGTTALIVLPPSMFAPLHSSAAAVNEGEVHSHVDDRPKSPRMVPLDHAQAPAPPHPPAYAEWTDGTGWWDPTIASAMPASDPTPDAVDGSALATATPVPAPSPTPSQPARALKRRVPQSHLFAQLRVTEPEPVAERPGPERTTAETAAALSRYQASRAAAQAAADEENRRDGTG
jgi:signal transduction histidine kinase